MEDDGPRKDWLDYDFSRSTWVDRCMPRLLVLSYLLIQRDDSLVMCTSPHKYACTYPGTPGQPMLITRERNRGQHCDLPVARQTTRSRHWNEGDGLRPWLQTIISCTYHGMQVTASIRQHVSLATSPRL